MVLVHRDNSTQALQAVHRHLVDVDGEEADAESHAVVGKLGLHARSAILARTCNVEARLSVGLEPRPDERLVEVLKAFSEGDARWQVVNDSLDVVEPAVFTLPPGSDCCLRPRMAGPCSLTKNRGFLGAVLNHKNPRFHLLLF